MRSREELLSLCKCEACPLAAQGMRNPVLGDGPETAEMVLVGEAPGRNEALLGKPFIGPSGNLLNKMLNRVGVRREEVYVTNTALCRPVSPDGKDAPPPPGAIAACRPRLLAEIADRQPKIVVSLGAPAMQTLLQTKESMSVVQGSVRYSDAIDQHVLATYHPAYILRKASMFGSLQGDLQRAVALIDGEIPFPSRQPEDHAKFQAFTSAQGEEALGTLQQLYAGEFGYTLACDIETTATDSTAARLLTVQFGNEHEAFVFDAKLWSGDSPLCDAIYDAMYDLLSSRRHTFIFHNMSFDLQFLKRDLGIHWSEMNLEDTICYALGTTEEGQLVGLKYLSRKYLNAPFYEDEIKKYLKTKADSFAKIPWNVLTKYAALDVIYTARLLPILQDECRKEGTLDCVRDVLMPAQLMFSDIESTGVAIDTSLVNELRKNFEPMRDQKRREIEQWAFANGWDSKWPINPASPPQMEHFLYDILGLQPPEPAHGKNKVKKNGQKSRPTGAEFREKYPDHPLTKLLAEFKLINHMLQTYVEGIVDDVRRGSGRVHPQFLLFGTITGRLAIHNPPLQTIPRETTTGANFANVRNLFVAQRLRTEPEDRKYIFIGADFKQLELRVGWYLSKDPAMGEAILAGDFHANTASKIYGIPLSEVSKVQRHNTKYVTFGIMYGRDAFSLWKGQLGESGMSLRESEEFLQAWWNQYPVFHEWWSEQREQPFRTGGLVTPFGRKRRFGFIPSNREDRKHMLNQAVNFPEQSTATDLTLLAAIGMNSWFQQTEFGRVLFLVHDSIELEAREEYLQETLERLYFTMTHLPPQLNNPPENFQLDVDIEYGKAWGDGIIWRPGDRLQTLELAELTGASAGH